MRIERHYTQPGVSPYELVAFATTRSEIRNPDGSIVFSLEGVEVPAAWSQVAADVLAQKYFRKAGVPARLKRVEEEGVPSFLWRSVPDETALGALPKGERFGSEISAKEVFDRLAGAWAYWGWKAGLFDGEEDARAYFDEMRLMLARQVAAPNSPQWFNTGLHWAYGVDGPSQGHYYVDFETGKLVKSKSAYEHPQPHACFIQSVADDLVNEGGIMDLWVREARLFKYGSGTGTNFSALRGENEKLSGGGRSSGLMSFLKIGDRAAGAIKSGGTTRRAAKMVVVDVDHPDIEAFIDWKVNEEQKVAALAAGSKVVKRHLKAIFRACVNCEGSGDDCFNVDMNPALKREVKAARKNEVPDGIIKRVIQFARQGYATLEFDTYDTDWESEAYLTVSGQNSNNSVRVTDEFLRAVENDGEWSLTRRLDGKVAKTLKARDLWERIGYAAWASADPGIQYHTTINDWHTCPEFGADRRLQSVLRVHVPRRHGLQSRFAQPAAVPRSREQGVRRQGLRARDPALDADARDLGRDGAVPFEGDRAAVVRLPHAWPRLRQYRRPPDVVGHSLRQRRGQGDLRRLDRDPHRARLCDFGRDRRQKRRLPRTQVQCGCDAARDPQSQARRRRRGRRL